MHEQSNPAFYSITSFFFLSDSLFPSFTAMLPRLDAQKRHLITMSTFFCTEHHLVKQNKKHSITENREWFCIINCQGTLKHFVNAATLHTCRNLQTEIRSLLLTIIMFIGIQSYWRAVIKPPTHLEKQCLTWLYLESIKSKLTLTLKNATCSEFPHRTTPAKNTELK